MDRGTWRATVHQESWRVGHDWSGLACNSTLTPFNLLPTLILFFHVFWFSSWDWIYIPQNTVNGFLFVCLFNSLDVMCIYHFLCSSFMVFLESSIWDHFLSEYCYIIIHRKYIFGYSGDQNIFLIYIFGLHPQFLDHNLKTVGISWVLRVISVSFFMLRRWLLEST